MASVVKGEEQKQKTDADKDLFTPEFKRLKARNPPPDFSQVLDLHKFSANIDVNIRAYPVRRVSLAPVFGLEQCENWKAFQFKEYPGLIIVQNPFIDGYQRYWLSRCLNDFPADSGNVTNLSALEDTEKACDLWQDFVNKKCDTFSKQDPLRKLRWTTLGYHYNWNTKEYSEDQRTEFPQDVNCLAQYLSACLGFGPYHAQAAIVNYYHLDSTLAGHTDHSEMDQSAPLFSISFGQSAVFLIGGSSKAVKPMSVLLRSGDICVMSGQCRLAYHAVPKILPPPAEELIPSCFYYQSADSSSAIETTKVIEENKSCQLEDQFVQCVDRQTSPDTQSTEEYTGFDISESAVMKSEASVKSHCCQAANVTILKENTDHTCAYLEKGESCQEGCDSSLDHERHNACFRHSFPETYVKEYEANVKQGNSAIQSFLPTLDFTPYEVYLKSSRINLNVRQVLPHGLTKLPNDNKMQSSKECSDAVSYSDNMPLSRCSAVGTSSHKKLILCTELSQDS